MTFWDHLDELRGVILRTLVAALAMSVAAFLLKDFMFSVMLAPTHSDFATYRFIDSIVSQTRGGFSAREVGLVSVNLTAQFVVHLRMALYVGLLAVSPYALFLLFGFIAPGLYAYERRYVARITVWGWISFVAGLILSYLVIFPLSLQFLAGYRVSADVDNMFTVTSYTDMFMILSLTMGIMFELPVAVWLLGKLGLVSRGMLRRYRRHALMLIAALAAVITPTTDIFTLTVVSLPVYLLYELGIVLCPSGDSMKK